MPISVPPVNLSIFPNGSPGSGSLKSWPMPLPGSPCPTNFWPNGSKSAHCSAGQVHRPSSPPYLRWTLNTG
jgi:hypothetical protein